MPVKSLDRRARMTREILKQSLIELMKTKPIHEISIKKICETADINRSTFYHHYDSQFDLFNDILNDIGYDIIEIVRNNHRSESWMKNILRESFVYIENHRDTILVILGENSGFSVGERLTTYVEKFVNTSLENSSEIAKYSVQFAVAGMTSVIWQWLNKEDRLPAEDLANMVNALLAPSIGRFSLFPFNN
ncbi:MAG: TetR/AcrR family transcriptional regulator [Clostridia bacterium]|nr:TetR/AcrR family transcriptional regulator [Clostridia bacterium]